VPLSRIIVFICSLALAPSLASASEYRSSTVKHEFQRQHPCPSTRRTTGACPGYVKDHIRALACGGPDSVENMQWQTVAAAKAKDRWERKGCERWRQLSSLLNRATPTVAPSSFYGGSIAHRHRNVCRLAGLRGRLGTSRTDRDPADASGDRCGPINRARASGLWLGLAPRRLARPLGLLALGQLPTELVTGRF